VVVTHEPEVAGFARRLLKFRDGQVVADETPPLRPQPAPAKDDAREESEPP
jgi:ABC-type lipoprotein export system ATPase subunit